MFHYLLQSPNIKTDYQLGQKGWVYGSDILRADESMHTKTS